VARDAEQPRGKRSPALAVLVQPVQRLQKDLLGAIALTVIFS
jgi:hypothetical protein